MWLNNQVIDMPGNGRDHRSKPCRTDHIPVRQGFCRPMRPADQGIGGSQAPAAEPESVAVKRLGPDPDDWPETDLIGRPELNQEHRSRRDEWDSLPHRFQPPKRWR